MTPALLRLQIDLHLEWRSENGALRLILPLPQFPLEMAHVRPAMAGTGYVWNVSGISWAFAAESATAAVEGIKAERPEWAPYIPEPPAQWPGRAA